MNFSLFKKWIAPVAILLLLVLCAIAQTSTPLTARRIGYTPQTKAHFTRAQLVLERDENAIDSMVRDLQTNNLYTNWVTLFPFAGSSETNHSADLAGPTNRVLWGGGANHTTNGATGNGAFNSQVLIDPFLGLGVSTNDFFLYAYYAGTNTGSRYLVSMIGGKAGFSIGSLTNFLVKTNASFFATMHAPGLTQGHILIFRTNGSSRLFVYSGSYTNFATNSYNVPAFTNGTLCMMGVADGESATSVANVGGVLRAVGMGNGRITFDQATNLFHIMRRYQRSLNRAVD